jgi:HTH-type transcriptional regulator / antitoxin HigA
MSTQVTDPIPPGQILARELEARGWTQADFAAVLGRPTQFVSEIVTGKKEITRESAAQIGAALGQSPEFWLTLQDKYLLNEQAKDHSAQKLLSEVRRRARLNELAPINTLRKRGVLTGRTLDELEAEVMHLFEIASIDDEPALTLAARRSNGDEAVSPAQKAWVACVRQTARARSNLQPFSRKKLMKLAAELPALLNNPDKFRNLSALFAAVGVALVHVEALPGAKIDGCSFFLGKMPVIGISGRGRRLDKILFTLLHEIAHVVLGHVSNETIVESLDDHNDSDTSEVEANRRAGNWLLPTPLPPAPERIGAAWVEHVADERGLAPIVVIGQLQNDGVLEWRSTLARNAPTVTAALENW